MLRSGTSIIISAGGSGTFNAVLEGCFDSGRDLSDVRLGFLRKGSADLIGKVLGMPDEIGKAVEVFVEAIREDRVVPCDVLKAEDTAREVMPRRFVGYGGAELFGRIPHYTENRFIKYYKGVLSQLFGDLGPFFVGTNLAILERNFGRLLKRPRQWTLTIDDNQEVRGTFQAIIIVNGDLGPNLPFARSEALGSGKFYLFTIRDQGMARIYAQLKRAWDASILENPERYGFESFTVSRCLKIEPDDEKPFDINVDGSTMQCHQSAEVTICDQVHLLSA